jgi:hypothetical protein
MTIDDRPEDQHKTEDLTESAEGGTDMQPGDSGGEDEGSAPIEGKDGHLKDDQKPITK